MSLNGSKRYFSWQKAYAIIFAKVSSDFKPFWQVTIFHTRLPHKPNHGLGLRQGRNSETYKNEFDWLKTIFFMKKGIRDHFCKVSSDFKPFWQLPYFTLDFPTNQILDWDLDKAEILKTYKNEFDWLKTIFFMKEGIRDHFCKVSSDLKPFWTSYHISHKTSPQTKSWIGTWTRVKFWKLTKMILTGSKRFFSWKKAYAIIFAKFQVI